MKTELQDETGWKNLATFDRDGGFFSLETRDTAGVPVRVLAGRLPKGVVADVEPFRTKTGYASLRAPKPKA